MKLTKEQLMYHKNYDGKIEELSGIYNTLILGRDTVRVLEIPSHIERVEIESIDVYSLFNDIDSGGYGFPQLKKLILPQKFRELIIKDGYYRYGGNFTIQQNGSMIYNGNLTFEIVFK
jgi:hypothetical protein